MFLSDARSNCTSRLSLSPFLLPLSFFYSQHHKSRVTYAAALLAVLAFLFSFRSVVAIIAGLAALLVVACTGCLRIPPPAFYAAAVAAVAAGIGDFVEAGRAGSGGTRVYAAVGGILWIAATGLIAKIPSPPHNDAEARSTDPSQATAHETV